MGAGVPDNGPVIAGVTWFLTLLSGGFLGTRIYAKLSRKQGLWWDDHILLFSWILLLSECIITQVGVQIGFGKRTIDINPQYLPIIALGSSVASSISCFASTLSKISFGVTLLRLTTGYLRAFVWFCIVTLFLIMLPSALGTWLACTPVEKAWNPSLPGTCRDTSGAIKYGIFNAAYCAWADIALALLPWYLIWGLQLRLREKIGVGVAMSMGVLAGVCAIVKGLYVIQLTHQDFSFNGKELTIWTAVETATAIIAASIPILRVFFKEKAKSYPRSHTHTGTTSVKLSRLNRSQTTTTVQAGGDKDFGWVSLGEGADGSSQRGILGDEERGREDDAGVVIHGDEGIKRTDTVTVSVAVESDARSGYNARSFFDIE